MKKEGSSHVNLKAVTHLLLRNEEIRFCEILSVHVEMMGRMGRQKDEG